MKRKKLLEQVKKLYINANSSVLDAIEKESDFFRMKIQNLKKINVDGVKEMVRIDDNPISYLRNDDDVKNNFSKSDFLSQCRSKEDDYVIIEKETKND